MRSRSEAGQPDHGTDNDAKHGGGRRYHPEQDVPGRDPYFERCIGTVDVEAPYRTKRPHIGRDLRLVLLDPEHGRFPPGVSMGRPLQPPAGIS